MKQNLLLLLMLLLPAVAKADFSGTWGEDVTYTFVEDTGTLTFSGTGEMKYQWASSLYPWWSSRKKIKTLIINEGITRITRAAFDGCSNMTRMWLPGTITTIDDDAFDGCNAIQEIYIPNIEGWCNITYGVGNSQPLALTKHLYINDVEVTDLVIPEGVTSIGSGAFSGSWLTSVSIPGSVTSIGRTAFSDCSSLTGITVAEGNTTYDSRDNCNAIIETATNTLVKGCQNTIIPSSVTTIGNYAFYYCSSLTSISIPSSVTSIGSSAFEGCSSLTSINIPSSVNSIGYNTFSGCSSLTSVSIPSSVTTIGGYAFEYCSSLTSISIPEGVTRIGSSAFEGCKSLTSITIPSSVTDIGGSAFWNCSSLTSVTSLIAEPFEIKESVFQYYDNGIKFTIATTATLYVPMGTKEKYEATAAWNQFQNIVEIEATGVEPATAATNAAEPTETYSLDGRRAAGPRKGLSIVKMSDGTVKKVLK